MDILTVSEAAQKLHVSVSQVYALVKREKLRGYRAGSKVLLFAKSIDEFIAGHSFGVKQEEAAQPSPAMPPPQKKKTKPRNQKGSSRLSSPFPFR